MDGRRRVRGRSGSDRTLLLAATAGTLGPALWFAVMIVLGASVPGYDSLTMPASELSLGSTGWVMIANFIALGTLQLVFAVGLWRAAGSSAAGRAGAALIGFAGACTLVAGPLVTDPDDALATLHAQLHLGAVTLAFAAVSAAALAFAWRYRDSRTFAIYSMLSGLTVLPLFVISEASESLLGLIQRTGIAVALAWLTLLALRLRREFVDPA